VAGVFRAGAGGRIYARLEDVQEAIGTPGKVSFFLVKGHDAGQAEKLAADLLARFVGHKITPVAQVSQAMQQNMVGLQEFKQAITGMAVMISFLVVLLAMYTAIIERTREIGILRAIGATRAKVVRLIVAESLLICLVGTLLGMLLAFGVKETFVHAFPTQIVQLTLPWALGAAGLGLAGGLLGSFYPALRAAKLDPVQALNFE
jgi:putative ABC transport system permease protein